MKQYVVLEKQSKATWEGILVEVDIDPGTYRAIGVYKTVALAEKARDARELQCCGDNKGTLQDYERGLADGRKSMSVTERK